MKSFKEFLIEIDRLSDDDFKGGTEHISVWIPQKYVPEFIQQSKPLPNSKDFVYTIISSGKLIKNKADVLIAIFDPSIPKCVGCLSLEDPKWSFLKPRAQLENHFQEDTISVDEDYRGRKIATSLYGIALSIMKVVLISDDLHTYGGEAMWKYLINIPGVNIYAIVSVKDLVSKDHIAIDPALKSISNSDVPLKAKAELLDAFFKKHRGCGRYIYDNSLAIFPINLLGEEVKSEYINVYDNKEVCLIAKFGSPV